MKPNILTNCIDNWVIENASIARQSGYATIHLEELDTSLGQLTFEEESECARHVSMTLAHSLAETDQHEIVQGLVYVSFGINQFEDVISGHHSVQEFRTPLTMYLALRSLPIPFNSKEIYRNQIAIETDERMEVSVQEAIFCARTNEEAALSEGSECSLLFETYPFR